MRSANPSGPKRGGDSVESPFRSYEFGTDGEVGKHRFELWQETFSPVHEVAVEASARVDFGAHGRNWFLGPMLFGEYETPERGFTRSDRQCSRDDLDHLVLRVPRSCTIRSQSHGQSVVLGPGELAFGTCAFGYDEWHSAGSWVTVLIPRDLIQWPRGMNFEPRVISGTMAGILADFLLSLGERLPHASPEETTLLSALLKSMVIACLTPRKEKQAASCLVSDDDGIQLPYVVQRVIEQNLASPRLTPGRVSELTGISRTRLYRMLEPAGGVAAHVQRLRLEAIRRDLQAREFRDTPIHAIAERHGMFNAAAFNRAFRRQFDCTPGDMRNARAERKARGPVTTLSGASDGCFIDLLRTASNP